MQLQNSTSPVRSVCQQSAVVAVAVLLLAGASGCRNDAAKGEPAAKRAKELLVPVIAPERVDKARTTTQPATVHAFYRAEIYAKAAGYVKQLKADIGQRVDVNNILAVISVPEMEQQKLKQLATIKRLEAEEARAAAEEKVAAANIKSYEALVDKAKADVLKSTSGVTAANSELERVTDLVNQKSVAKRLLDESQQKYDTATADESSAQAAVKSAAANLNLAIAKQDASAALTTVAKETTNEARAELAELEALMEYATLTAPFKGIVVERDVDPGDLVRNVQAASGREGPLFVVAQIDPVRIRVSVPERAAPLAGVGDKARITLQALGGEIIEAPIARISGALDESTRTMTVEIDVRNPDGKLLPGMFGQATIVLEPPTPRIMLPANAVRYDEHGRSYVYVVGGANQIQVVDVETGLDTGEQIEIKKGLIGSERIVGPMLRRLKQGQTVRVE